MLNTKALAGAPSTPPAFVDDVFSTFLYTGNSSTQTITNGIDLAGKGGLTWLKSRSAATNHFLFDTTRGALNEINSNTQEAQASLGNSLTSFNSNGFSLGSATGINVNAATYCSWTFREQAKFFDVVTFTTNSSKPPNTGNIAHNLGSTPGCVMIKNTGASQDWFVYHTGLTQAGGFLATNRFLQLNSDIAAQNSTNWINVSSTNISFPGSALDSDSTYVAYLFAHNAGGFGAAGTDNVISCGSFTTGTGFGAFDVNLGYEPQWVMIKKSSGTDNWRIFDIMRGFNTRTLTGDADAPVLYPNLSEAEINDGYIGPYATGFSSVYTGTPSTTYIYMAIRRPMKPPTSGTQVFKSITYTGTGSADTVTGVGFAPDLVIGQSRSVANGSAFKDRLRGSTVHLYPSADNAEGTGDSTAITSFNMNGISLGTDAVTGCFNNSGTDYVGQFFKRAPGFMDEVCYTGTGSARTVAHNLSVVPELMIVKRRSAANDWAVYANNDNTDYLVLNTNAATADDNTYWNDTSPTSSVFSVGTNNAVNASVSTYVAYLFATLAGVSKVGSYTGTAAAQTINCGFTAGARFVLIKRTNSTGDWYVWDTARGIISGNDPYLLLNSSDVEVTNTDYIDPANSGFEISSTAPAAINANGGSFIFMAIA